MCQPASRASPAHPRRHACGTLAARRLMILVIRRRIPPTDYQDHETDTSGTTRTPLPAGRDPGLAGLLPRGCDNHAVTAVWLSQPRGFRLVRGAGARRRGDRAPEGSGKCALVVRLAHDRALLARTGLPWPPAAAAVTTIGDLPTPALVVDLAALDDNIAVM